MQTIERKEKPQQSRNTEEKKIYSHSKDSLNLMPKSHN
jgi:hypothetical protein